MGFGSYGFYMLVMFLTTGFLFLIGLSFNRIKAVRYFFWILATVAFLLAITSIFKHNNRIKQQEKSLVGTFHLSLTESILKGYDTAKYSGVSLTVLPNNTFKIEPQVPFIEYNKGTWHYIDDGEVAYIQINGESHNQAMTGKDSWMFRLPPPKHGQIQVEQLVFKK